MKSHKKLPDSFICSFLFLTLSLSVSAQVTGYKSPVTLAAERLLATTQPDYYSRLVFNQLAASLNPCANSLCKNIALPVKLIRFGGERTGEKTVALFWETAQEISNDHFEVERTLDPTAGYETVVIVKGAGSSESAVRYETTDPNHDTSYTYYRLKQVDIDGTFEYSSVIAVKGRMVPLTITPFPNPARSGKITFKVAGLKASEQLAVVVYDAVGRALYRNSSLILISEKPVFEVHLPNALPGKYSIRITGNKQSSTSSFILIP